MKRNLILLLVFAVVIAGALVAALGRSSPSAPYPSADSSLSDSFEILRSPSQDAYSPSARRSLRSAALVEPDARISGFHLAKAASEFWVLPTQRSLCIAQPRGASCVPKKVAVRDGVFLATFRPPTKHFPAPRDFLLQGLVPDGVGRVFILIGKRRRLIVDVKRNAFSVERDQPVHLMRLLDGD